jgi:hypothetical protein
LIILAPGSRLLHELASPLICPTSYFADPYVQPRFEKYFYFHLTQITGLSRAIPFPIEGRFAIVTDVGFGMRWTRRARGTKR